MTNLELVAMKLPEQLLKTENHPLTSLLLASIPCVINISPQLPTRWIAYNIRCSFDWRWLLKIVMPCMSLVFRFSWASRVIPQIHAHENTIYISFNPCIEILWNSCRCLVFLMLKSHIAWFPFILLFPWKHNSFYSFAKYQLISAQRL